MTAYLIVCVSKRRAVHATGWKTRPPEPRSTVSRSPIVALKTPRPNCLKSRGPHLLMTLLMFVVWPPPVSDLVLRRVAAPRGPTSPLSKTTAGRITKLVLYKVLYVFIHLAKARLLFFEERLPLERCIEQRMLIRSATIKRYICFGGRAPRPSGSETPGLFCFCNKMAFASEGPFPVGWRFL